MGPGFSRRRPRAGGRDGAGLGPVGRPGNL